MFDRNTLASFTALVHLSRWSWRCQRPQTSSSPLADSDSHSQDHSNDVEETDMGSSTTLADENGRHAGQDERRGRRRVRKNTGVASLLVALAQADPSGETIKSMMRWAREGLMPEQVSIDAV